MTVGFLLFAVIAVVLPGPDLGLVVSQALRSRSAGLLATAGVASGLLLHTGLAAVGVTGLVASVPSALAVLQFLGAAVLIVMGVGMICSPVRLGAADPALSADPPRFGRSGPWLIGLVVNVTNAKTWIAFLAVLPALLETDDGDSLGAVMLLAGGTLGLLAAGWYAIVALAVSGWASRRGQPRILAPASRLAGVLLVGFGAASMLSVLG